jgi:TrmH family RNA methyltransferase
MSTFAQRYIFDRSKFPPINKIIQNNKKFEHQFQVRVISKQQIKYIRSLHQKKYRTEFNCYIAEGTKIVNEAIDSQPNQIELLIYTPATKKKLNLKALDKKTTLIQVNDNEFSKISGQKTPQEVLVVLRKKGFVNELGAINGKIVLALDRIQDPGNLGTIIRLADWFGINDILCSDECADRYNPKVIQASMGAFLRVKMHYGRLVEMLSELKRQKDYSIYGASLKGDNLFTANLSEKALIVLGNEASGISELISSHTDQKIMIPNFGTHKEKSESLNVAVAAAIICAEFRRRE